MTALLKQNITPAPHSIADFQPAFFDMETGETYLSRFSDGLIAPVHILEGLPADIQWRADINIVSGYIRASQFYTREQALKVMQRKS